MGVFGTKKGSRTDSHFHEQKSDVPYLNSKLTKLD